MTRTPQAEREYPPEELLDWTKRQEEVLGLLAKGKSNPDIAEELGLSLEGAKHHVREIMSKLDVDNREDAAEYWRWRQGLPRRLGRALGAFAGLGPLRVAAGVTAVAVAVGAVFGAYMLLSGDEETFEGYYLRYEHADSGWTYHWWVVDETRWRMDFEIEPQNGREDTWHRMTGTDGETAWSYDPQAHEIEMYTPPAEFAADVLSLPMQQRPLGFRLPGPIHPGIADVLIGEREYPGITVNAVEEGEHSGRPVLVVETVLDNQDPPLRLTTYLDRQLGVVLEQGMNNGDDGGRRVVSQFDEPVEMSGSFFEPPEGDDERPAPEEVCAFGGWTHSVSTEAQDPARALFQEQAWRTVPIRFAELERVSGWDPVEVSYEPECAAPWRLASSNHLSELLFPAAWYEIVLHETDAAAPREVTISQEPGDEVGGGDQLPDEFSFRGRAAYGLEDDEGARMRWSDGEAVITITGEGMGLAELMDLADAVIAD